METKEYFEKVMMDYNQNRKGRETCASIVVMKVFKMFIYDNNNWWSKVSGILAESRGIFEVSLMTAENEDIRKEISEIRAELSYFVVREI